MTRSAAAAGKLVDLGASVVEVSALDAPAVERALRESGAEVVIDELTSLPKDPMDMASAAAGDRKLRLEGGGNLFRAAEACGVRRYLQQASGFFLKAASGLATEIGRAGRSTRARGWRRARGRMRSWRRGYPPAAEWRASRCAMDSFMGRRPGTTPTGLWPTRCDGNSRR